MVDGEPITRHDLNLIALCRQIVNGDFRVKVQNGIPIRYEKAIGKGNL